MFGKGHLVKMKEDRMISGLLVITLTVFPLVLDFTFFLRYTVLDHLM